MWAHTRCLSQTRASFAYSLTEEVKAGHEGGTTGRQLKERPFEHTISTCPIQVEKIIHLLQEA